MSKIQRIYRVLREGGLSLNEARYAAVRLMEITNERAKSV